jgi:hypothetical protein
MDIQKCSSTLLAGVLAQHKSLIRSYGVPAATDTVLCALHSWLQSARELVYSESVAPTNRLHDCVHPSCSAGNHGKRNTAGDERSITFIKMAATVHHM